MTSKPAKSETPAGDQGLGAVLRDSAGSAWGGLSLIEITFILAAPLLASLAASLPPWFGTLWAVVLFVIALRSLHTQAEGRSS